MNLCNCDKKWQSKTDNFSKFECQYWSKINKKIFLERNWGTDFKGNKYSRQTFALRVSKEALWIKLQYSLIVCAIGL